MKKPTIIEELLVFTAEVTRVAREVGTGLVHSAANFPASR